MPCTPCSVVVSPGGLFVQCDMQLSGPYRDYDTALRVAVAHAQDIGRRGSPARVTVRGVDGEVTAEVCLCERFAAGQQQAA